jgi:hypothetical protein
MPGLIHCHRISLRISRRRYARCIPASCGTSARRGKSLSMPRGRRVFCQAWCSWYGRGKVYICIYTYILVYTTLYQFIYTIYYVIPVHTKIYISQVRLCSAYLDSCQRCTSSITVYMCVYYIVSCTLLLWAGHSWFCSTLSLLHWGGSSWCCLGRLSVCTSPALF